MISKRVVFAYCCRTNTGTHRRDSVQWREDELDGRAGSVEG